MQSGFEKERESEDDEGFVARHQAGSGESTLDRVPGLTPERPTSYSVDRPGSKASFVFRPSFLPQLGLFLLPRTELYSYLSIPSFHTINVADTNLRHTSGLCRHEQLQKRLQLSVDVLFHIEFA